MGYQMFIAACVTTETDGATLMLLETFKIELPSVLNFQTTKAHQTEADKPSSSRASRHRTVFIFLLHKAVLFLQKAPLHILPDQGR